MPQSKIRDVFLFLGSGHLVSFNDLGQRVILDIEQIEKIRDAHTTFFIQDLLKQIKRVDWETFKKATDERRSVED